MTWLLVILLMTIGMVLLVTELAIIPGFGVAGIAAIVFLAGGVILAWTRHGVAWGVGSLLVATVLTIGVIVIAPRTRAGRALVLDSVIKAQHPAQELGDLVGRTGIAASSLRPAGAAEFAGRRVDVVTDGEFIVAGSKIRVVSVEGTRVVVVADQS